MISAQQPVSSRTSRRAACSWDSLASTWPLGSVQMRGVPRPMSKASYVDSRRRSTSPPAETSYLIRIAKPLKDRKGAPSGSPPDYFDYTGPPQEEAATEGVAAWPLRACLWGGTSERACDRRPRIGEGHGP